MCLIEIISTLSKVAMIIDCLKYQIKLKLVVF